MGRADDEAELARLSTRVAQLEEERDWRKADWQKLRNKAKVILYGYYVIFFVAFIYGQFFENDKLFSLLWICVLFSITPINLLT